MHITHHNHQTPRLGHSHPCSFAPLRHSTIPPRNQVRCHHGRVPFQNRYAAYVTGTTSFERFEGGTSRRLRSVDARACSRIAMGPRVRCRNDRRASPVLALAQGGRDAVFTGASPSRALVATPEDGGWASRRPASGRVGVYAAGGVSLRRPRRACCCPGARASVAFYCIRVRGGGD